MIVRIFFLFGAGHKYCSYVHVLFDCCGFMVTNCINNFFRFLPLSSSLLRVRKLYEMTNRPAQTATLFLLVLSLNVPAFEKKKSNASFFVLRRGLLTREVCHVFLQHRNELCITILIVHAPAECIVPAVGIRPQKFRISILSDSI